MGFSIMVTHIYLGVPDMKTLSFLAFVMSVLIAFAGCGPRAFVEGDYDEDVEAANLLTDKWSESDMQRAVQDLVASATNHYSIKSAKKPPVVVVTRLQNKTSEHIDTQNITDMIRVELQRSGRFQFLDKSAREDIADEIDYQQENAGRSTRKRGGKQVGADFVMNGRLDSIVQQAGKKKTVYYKLTLNLTDLQTTIIVWSDYKQIRKRFSKRRVGL